MAAIIGGLTLLQLVQIVSGLTGASLNLERLITDLKSHGHKPEDVLPQEHQEAVRQALRPILAASIPAWGPAVSTGPDGTPLV